MEGRAGDVMNLLKCSRCDFIAHIYMQDWTRLCPICGGVFFPLDSSRDEEAGNLRFFKAIQAIRRGEIS